MKRIAILIVLCGTLAIAPAAGLFASPITITDNYIGGSPTHPAYNGFDVIGAPAYFDIDRMEVGFSGNQMTVNIFSSYFDNVGLYSTALGDLFISTNGYDPVTPGGEIWEYAVSLDDHLGTSGSTNIYAVNNASTILSSAPPGYIYRAGQEVQYNGSGQNPLDLGTWFISNTKDYLSITILMLDDWSTVPAFGFHWAMTCGNDVIEGSAPSPVPEPATILLYGSGLIGLAGFGRKLKKA